MDENFKKITNIILIVILLVLAFLIIKPILLSIIIALILTFIFAPVYDKINSKLKNKNLSAILILVTLLLIIVLPCWFILPMLLRQSIEVFQTVSAIDFVKPIKAVFPSLFATDEFSKEIAYAFSSLTTKAIDAVINLLTQTILNIPMILLHLVVIFFVLFFVIREKEMVLEYVQSLMPFSKDMEKRLFEQTKGITSSIIYGQFIVGIIQGLTVGIGLFIFRIPHALPLTTFAILLGILPVVGTLVIYLPLVLYLFSVDQAFSATGILIFGIISSNIDNILRPMIVSRRTNLNTGITFISMVGGLFFFGVLGLILGPLIISYLFLVLELYRGKGKPVASVD